MLSLFSLHCVLLVAHAFVASASSPGAGSIPGIGVSPGVSLGLSPGVAPDSSGFPNSDSSDAGVPGPEGKPGGMGWLGVLLVPLCLAMVAWFFYLWYLDSWRMAKMSESLPGPRPLPIIGNLYDLLHDLRNVRATIQNMLDKYGYTMRLWFGPHLVVLVMDAADAEAVFTDLECAVKPSAIYRMVGHFLGEGLVTLNGPIHRRHRKLILPSLHKDMLVDFFPYMRLAVEELVDSLKPFAASGEVFDVKPLCGMALLSSTYLNFLNTDSSKFKVEERAAFVHNVERMSYLVLHRALRPWHHWNWLFRLSANYTEYKAATGQYDKLVMEVLNEKLEQRRRGEAPPPRRRLAFVDHVIATDSEQSLTRDELFEELKTMISASFATSMDTVSMMMLLLSIMPDIQAKVRQELDDIFDADPGRELELGDLDHMQYMEQVIKETLRCFPSFPILARTCQRDLKLPSGHVVPKNGYIGLCPLAMHFNPKYFPDPVRFDPDRFLPEAARTRHPYAYVPFSAGPRSCIGQKYAMMLLKTALSAVLRRYDVLPDPDGPQHYTKIRMRSGITLFPRDGTNIRLRARVRDAKA